MPYDWPKTPAQEKGIDVALAVDFVTMAVRGEYDIGVLMWSRSGFRSRPSRQSSSSAADPIHAVRWRPGRASGAYSRRLHVPGQKVWCHWLKPDDYAAVEDHTDFNLPSSWLE